MSEGPTAAALETLYVVIDAQFAQAKATKAVLKVLAADARLPGSAAGASMPQVVASLKAAEESLSEVRSEAFETVVATLQ